MSAARPFAVLTVLLFLAVPHTLADHGSADNGTDDGGNSRATAKEITNGNYIGSVGGTDSADWFKFRVTSTTGDLGLPLLDVQVRSQGGWSPGLALWDPENNDDRAPTVSGRGSGGAKILRTSLDMEGDWLMRVTGSGHYELRFNLGPENDLGLGRDAPDNTDDAIAVPTGATDGNLFYEGKFTQNDDGDSYKLPQVQGRVLVALYRAPSSGHDLELIGPGATLVNPVGHNSDDNLVTVYLDGGRDDWRIRVTNPDGVEGPYRLAFRVGAPTDKDADAGADAPNPEPAQIDAQNFELKPGLRVGKLSQSEPTDRGDAYRLPNIRLGDVMRLGVSSHEGKATRLQVTVTLYDPQKRVVQTLDPCQGAASIVRTAEQSGTWYVRVREATNAGRCDPLPTDNGPYSIAYELQRQHEKDDNDAPNEPASAAQLAVGAELTGWMDDVDKIDTYKIGHMSMGKSVRITYQSLTEGLATEVKLMDANSVTVASTKTSGGATRVEATAARTDVHYVQLARYEDDDNPPTSGAYKFDVILLENQPPLIVSLADPGDSDVGRNTVALRWSRNPDADFAKYEVHVGTTSNFVPGQNTVHATIDNQTVTSHTVTGLEAGRTYTFLIRVVDDTGLHSDSNRRTETTDNDLLSNTAPTLADGKVTPTSGGPSTPFSFSVKYTDANNDTPTLRRLYIDGGPVEMTTNDKKYTDGSVFYYNATLAPGVHSFFFEFNDGTAGVRNPSSGTHSGPTVTREDNEPPTADAGATPTSGGAPLRVQFTVTARDPENGPLKYEWDFDNSNGFSNQSDQRQPVHTYTAQGTYTATVRVTDNKSATSTDSVTINVGNTGQNPLPTVNPSASPTSGEAPLPVQFRANAADSAGGRVVAYAWDFDNGDGIQNDSRAENPTHTYPRGGSFVATVTVTDDAGGTSTGSVTVIVRSGGNSPPTIRISASPTEGDAPLPVNFTATVNDPEGETVAVTWDFALENGVQNQATGLAVSHTFGTPGTYTILATARDHSGLASTDSTVITVVGTQGGNGTGPVRIIAEPREGRAPLTVAFSAAADAGVNLTTYSWDFGDGTPLETTPTPTHVFDRSGRFTVTLRAADENGTEYTAATDVMVSGQPQGSPNPSIAWLLLGTVAAAFVVARRRGPDRF